LKLLLSELLQIIPYEYCRYDYNVTIFFARNLLDDRFLLTIISKSDNFNYRDTINEYAKSTDGYCANAIRLKILKSICEKINYNYKGNGIELEILLDKI
jgi:hypothetical protein